MLTRSVVVLVTALQIGMPVLAGCTSAPPPIAPPIPQEVHPVALEQSGLVCLDQASEVVAAHHEQAPLFAASSCDTRALDYAGAFGAIGAIAALAIASACRGPGDGFYVDIAAVVRDRFVATLAPEPIASKLSSPAACPAGDSVTALRQSFGERPVIDFKTVSWQRITAGGFPVFVPSLVRGRLVDLKDHRVLWEESCAISPDRAPARLDEVRGSLELSADACAKSFAERVSQARPAG